jgi:hypothetical protein
MKKAKWLTKGFVRLLPETGNGCHALSRLAMNSA